MTNTKSTFSSIFTYSAVFLLLPLNAYAHGEEAFYCFDISIVAALSLGLIFCKRVSKRNKLIIAIPFITFHAIGFASINYGYADPLMSLIYYILKDDGLASLLGVLTMLYIFPLIVSGLAGYILSGRKSNT